MSLDHETMKNQVFPPHCCGRGVKPVLIAVYYLMQFYIEMKQNYVRVPLLV